MKEKKKLSEAQSIANFFIKFCVPVYNVLFVLLYSLSRNIPANAKKDILRACKLCLLYLLVMSTNTGLLSSDSCDLIKRLL